MTSSIRSLLITLALLTSTMPAHAQKAPEARAAEAVVQQAFGALEATRWREVAALVHPDALRRFHLAHVDRVRAQEKVDTRMPADVPPEVQAWFEERRRKQEEHFPAGISGDFVGISTLAELERLPPEEAFARWVEAHDPRTQVMRAHEAADHAHSPECTSAGESLLRHDVVGSVVEDDSTVQVLYRSRHRGGDEVVPDRPSIATLRRLGDEWRIWTTWYEHQLFGPESFVVWYETPEDRVERLTVHPRTFAWPEGGSPRLRVSIAGYAGDGMAPESLVVETVEEDGVFRRVELPNEAAERLLEFLSVWTHLPARGAERQP